MGKTYNISLSGDCSPDPQSWMSWLDFVEHSILKFGFKLTHMGVRGEGFSSGKVLTYVRARNRVKKSLAEGKSLLSIEGYTLQEGFHTAAFDYEAYMVRSSEFGYVLVSVADPIGKLLLSDESLWRAAIEEHVVAGKGEIFTLDREESAAFYVAGGKPREEYRSLEVLRDF